MLNTVFSGVPERAFERCLELGAGDGYLSTLLVRCARVVVSTEIRIGSLEERALDAHYAVCDAEQLPFRSAKFDLIFSSHLLEHLPDLPGALREMRRALRPDGVMVHLVPTRLWKVLDLGLFFPSQLVHLIEKHSQPSGEPGRRRGALEGGRSTVKQPQPSWWRRSFWPPVHGVGRSNAAELLRFGVRLWSAEFERAGFDVACVRRRLPFHSPYRFGFEKARSLLESLGASSTFAFVLTHAGHRPPSAGLFAEDAPAASL